MAVVPMAPYPGSVGELIEALEAAAEVRTACALCPTWQHIGTAASGRLAFARHEKGKRHRARLERTRRGHRSSTMPLPRS